jgi:hypothetical protein
MQRSHLSHLVFVWLHPVLAFFMLVSTVGIVMLYEAINSDKTADHYFRKLVSWGSFVQMLILIIMRIEHKGVVYAFQKPTRVLYLLFRISIAFGHISLLEFEGSCIYLMMLHAMLGLVVNCFDIFLRVIKPEVHEGERETDEFLHVVEPRITVTKRILSINTQKSSSSDNNIHRSSDLALTNLSR